MKRNLFALTILSLLTNAGCAKLVVVPVPGPDATAANETVSTTNNDGTAQRTDAGKKVIGGQIIGEGVFYALPRTVARVVVKADKVTTASARFARFAAIFAPGNEPVCGKIVECAKLGGEPGKKTKYSIEQGATFSSFGEPDPARVFMVKFTGGGALDQTVSMGWNEMGLLSTASATVTNRTTDIVVSGVKLATSIGTKLAAGAAEALGQPNDQKCYNGTGMESLNTSNDRWIIPILKQAGADLQTNALVANYCTLPPTDRPGHKDEDSRDDYDQTRDSQALQLAVNAWLLRVAPFVSQRTAVLTSSTVNLLDPIKYVDKLGGIIDEELKDLFVGSKDTKTWELPFEVRDFLPDHPIRILGINEVSGLCPEAQYLAPDAKPAPEGVDTLKGSLCDKALNMTVAYHPAKETQLFSRVEQGTKEAAGDRSFRYIVPAQVRAEVAMDEQSYGTGVFSVAQFGHMASLPARRRSKTITYDLAMVEATGGLKSFKLGTTGGLDAATIDAFSTAAGSVLDTRNANRKEADEKRKDAENAADEVTVLTRQQTILKLKDEICELQKKYGLGCTIQP